MTRINEYRSVHIGSVRVQKMQKKKEYSMEIRLHFIIVLTIKHINLFGVLTDSCNLQTTFIHLRYEI